MKYLLLSFILAAFVVGNHDVTVELHTHLTYKIDVDQVYVSAGTSYQYLGTLDQYGDLSTSIDDGRSYNPTNLALVWEDIWEDDPRELKVWSNQNIVGYLYETDVNSNLYKYEYYR